MNFKFYISILLILINASIDLLKAHGFGAITRVKTDSEYGADIDNIYRYKRSPVLIESYDPKSCKSVITPMVNAGSSETNCYYSISLDKYKFPDIVCTPTQEFYVPKAKKWVPAHKLKVGDQLLSRCTRLIKITQIELVNKPIDIYSIEVKSANHNFFVGGHDHFVLTHNMALPLAITGGLSVAFGETAAAVGAAAGSFFGPITATAGLALGGLVGIAVDWVRDVREDVARPKYTYSFDIKFLEDQSILKADKAPGKPTEKDGFKPKKNWDGKKIKNPNGPGYGWPDKDGNVWIPTGENGHGGPHWDVESPDGGYKNIVPGGKERGKKK